MYWHLKQEASTAFESIPSLQVRMLSSETIFLNVCVLCHLLGAFCTDSHTSIAVKCLRFVQQSEMKRCFSQACSIHLTSLFTFASAVSEVHAILYSWAKIGFFGTMTSAVLVSYYHMTEIHL
jgi:hypothetical protein